MGFFGETKRIAVFNAARTFRFRLTIIWNGRKPDLNFVGCNPSTADENENDATVERLQVRAGDWGYGSLTVTNLFAFKATFPKDLLAAHKRGVEIMGTHEDGRSNDAFLLEAAQQADRVLCGWGTHGALLGRGAHVITLLRQQHKHKLTYLKLCKDGNPQHPLYLPYDLRPLPL